MTAPGDPTDPLGTEPVPGDDSRVRQPGEPWDDRPPLEEAPANTKRLALVVAAGIALIAVIVAVAWFARDDEDGAVTTEPSVTEATEIPGDLTEPEPEPSEPEPDGTEAPEPTDPPAPVEPGPLEPADAAVAMWPDPSAASTFTDPVEAAAGFAVDVLGIPEPLMGPYQGGDGRSGEIEVQSTPDGPITRVLVRMLGPGDRWWVLGASSRDISVDVPQAQATVTDPLAVSGQASAFEGTVQVRIFADGSLEPIGVGFVTGSGTAELGPFSGEIPFASPGAGFGTLVLFTESPEDGSVVQATALRIAFGG